MRLGSSLDSSLNKGKRAPMDFGEKWGEGTIFDVYRNRLTSKMMVKLEIRITISPGVAHRFAVAHMSDGSVCRFDRRPEDPNAVRLAVETFTTPERRAADEMTYIKVADVAPDLTSRQEVEITLPHEVDVAVVLSACYAMSRHPEASIYALREYNCYFFAWTIAMVVMRHTLPFTHPSPEDVRLRLLVNLDNFTKSLTDKIVDALLKIVLDTITAFKKATGSRLYSGLSKRELVVWGLPVPIVRALLYHCLKLRLHFGLEAQLRERVSSQLQARAPEILEQVLNQQSSVGEDIKNRLWLFDLSDVFSTPVQNRILAILWDSLLDALAEGYGDLKQDFDQDISQLPRLHRLKYRFFGDNVIQFSQLWNAALHAALPAARSAGYKKYTLETSHAVMFDMAFEAGCAAALQAAQDVVRETSPRLNNPKREEMWKKVWEVWDIAWEQTQITAQEMAVDLIEDTMKEIVGWVTSDVVKELGNNQEQNIDSTVQFKKKKSSKKRMSLELFQKQIRDFISAVPGQTPGHRKNMEKAMANAWKISEETYKPIDVPFSKT
ncbi:hypothetical protein RhiLY_08712 [Ceratobasidium sp. AG-Ba]|nr:hypothetical protein RhiLY_08712 [Ceratobasidium sp. AG-Ba]